MNRLDQEKRDKKIANEIANGKSTSEILVKFHINRACLYRICDKFGCKPMRTTQSKNLERNKKIIELVTNGETSIEIAKKLKIGYDVVCRVRQLNCNYNYFENNKIKCGSMIILSRLFEKNESMTEICKKLHVSRQRVQQVYKKAKEACIPGLPIRKSR